MKRASVRSAIIVVALLSFVSCTASPHHVLGASPSVKATAVLSSPSSEPLTCTANGQLASIKMVSATVGWAVAQAPPGCDGNLRAILRTSNGGRSWRNVTPPAAVGSTYSASFVGVDHAWTAARATNGSKTTRVLVTSNGGKTWHAAGSIRAYGFCCGSGTISFVSERDGWIYEDLGAAAGSEGVAILRSHDAGSSWQLAALADPNTETSKGLTFGCDKGASFSGSATAWAAGSCADRPLFLVSRNGGHSWSDVQLPEISSRTGGFVDPPIFVSPTVGIVHVSQFISGPNSTRYVELLFATKDGGREWRSVTLPRAAGIVTPAVLDATHWWLVRSDEHPRLFMTSDAGRSWETVTPSIRLMGTQVILLGPRRAIDVPLDRAGPMLQTVDGGKTWRPYSLVIE